MPQKLQPRGISLAGLGHPGDGLVPQSPDPVAGAAAAAGKEKTG